jgi:hypothetical protein
MGLFNLFNKAKEPAKQAENVKEKKGSRLSDQVNLPQPDRVQMELGTLRSNVTDARDTKNPSWVELYRMYENTLTDAEVITQRRIAVNKMKAEKFIVSKDGTDSEELSALFNRPWFSQFKEALIDGELWGYRLAEFGQFDENGEFIDCKLFPAMNVYPHNRNIILQASDRQGIPYANSDPDKGEIINPSDLFLVEIGNPKSLGLLEMLTREVIIKSFARRDWNEHSERWGQPMLVVQSDAEGKDATVIENGARNFGRNRYALVGTDDVVTVVADPGTGSSHLIYEANMNKCDMYIAKIINGQYGTGTEKAFVGTAKVAEHILDDFHSSRLRDAQDVINYRLIPFLAQWGYPLEGCMGRFPSLDAAPTVSPDGGAKEPDEDDPDEKIKKDAAAKFGGKKKVSAIPWE